MNTSVLSSKSGQPTLQVDGRFWHSSYDPVREASQWAARLTLEKPVILLLGDGLGYAEAAINEKFPKAVTAAARVAAGTRDRLHWDPQDSRTARAWLQGFLTGKSAARLQTVVWPAAVTHAPDFVKNLLDTVASVLREEEANLATHRGMGRVWLANAIRRSFEADQLVRLQPHQGPLVLAASGPSLEALLSRPQLRRRYQLVALASATPALAARGWQADAVALTDGGYWAGRLSPPPHLPVLAPAAAFPHGHGPWAAFTQGYLYERFLFGEHQFPDIPARGTVAYSALSYLEETVSGPIIAAGLDLCDTRGRRHLSPHPIDEWLTHNRMETKATRLTADNLLRGAKVLAPGVTQTAAAALYASGFGSQPKENRYRLDPTASRVPGFHPLDAGQLETFLPRSEPLPLNFQPAHQSINPKQGILLWKRHIDQAVSREDWDDAILQEAWSHLVPTERAEILQASLEGVAPGGLVQQAVSSFKARWSNLWRRFLR